MAILHDDSAINIGIIINPCFWKQARVPRIVQLVVIFQRNYVSKFPVIEVDSVVSKNPVEIACRRTRLAKSCARERQEQTD